MGEAGAETAVSAALVEALSNVSANAVAGLVDALLLTTKCSPSLLLLSLLRRFPNLYQMVIAETGAALKEGELNTIQTYLSTVIHLIKHKSCGDEDFLRALWTVCMPLLRIRDPDLRILQLQVAEMLGEATSVRCEWEAVKRSVVPLCLNSLYPGLEFKIEVSGVEDLGSVAYGSWRALEMKYNVASERTSMDFQDNLLSVYAATQVVATLLSTALETTSSLISQDVEGRMANRDAAPPQRFCEDMVSVFLSPAMGWLSQPLDESLRRYSRQNLLPPLLRSATRFGWLDDVSPEKKNLNTRASPMAELWVCCQALWSQGALHQREVFMALASLAEFLLPTELSSRWKTSSKDKMDIQQQQNYDVRDDAKFWELLKVGLGDKESLTRRRALYVLKRALYGPKASADGSNNSEMHSSTSPGKNVSRRNSDGPKSTSSTKRSKRAEEEAGSLGVNAIKNKMSLVEGWSQRWDAFVLLHETLEEYGTHLVDAAWNHQMSLLLQFTNLKGDSKDSGPYWVGQWSQKKSPRVDINFAWISVLWQLGFDHPNPRVRHLVMQSFLKFEWDRIRKLSSLVPEEFVLGSLLQALDDAILHQDFGTKGIYTSETAERAAKFMTAYSSSMTSRWRIGFVLRFLKGLLSRSRTRPGLMTLALCLEAAAQSSSSEKLKAARLAGEQLFATNEAETLHNDEDLMGMLELLKSVIENSKRHFNPKYRAKVCRHVLKTLSNLVVPPSVPFRRFASFLASFPKEFLIRSGCLHVDLMSWIHPTNTTNCPTLQLDIDKWLVEGLRSMAEAYLQWHGPLSSPVSDEDVEAWTIEAEKWARLLAYGLVDDIAILQALLLIQQNALQIYNRAYTATCIPMKTLLLIQSLLTECAPSGNGCFVTSDCNSIKQPITDDAASTSVLASITNMVLSVLDEIKDYASWSAAIFWKHDQFSPVVLPAPVNGKLGGPSQRRLPSTLTSSVLQAVIAMSTTAKCCVWCCQMGRKLDISESVLNCLWQYAWDVTTAPNPRSEVGAEIHLAAYEALGSVCSALAAAAHPYQVTVAHASVQRHGTTSSSFPPKAELMVDGFVNSLLQNVSASEFAGALARSRIAIVTLHKWSCLDSLLSIPKIAVSGCEGDAVLSATSKFTLEAVLQISIESLESAGEDYLLPLLRCIRWMMHWGVLQQMDNDEDPQKTHEIMWTLVQSGWFAMADCNKRKVAPMAAFLSAIFHPSIFGDLQMHGCLEDDEEYGPLKWLLNRLIEQGSQSPRTMRLTALHATGLWLMHPGTTVFYMSELKTLALHGGEAVDEELDGELMGSHTSAREYAALIKSTDPELTEEFTNSEMYVRIMVAVMVHELAELVEGETSEERAGTGIRLQALNFGRNFLMVLLEAAATDADLSKELYKKNSAIHRRKVRVWQMLCILSRFLNEGDVPKAMILLKSCLYKNNVPSVRQYIETFATLFFLRFPDLVKDSLITNLYDYNMKPQCIIVFGQALARGTAFMAMLTAAGSHGHIQERALSSYVLIGAKVLMLTPAPQQQAILQKMLPAILPFMTSHHHSLRSFTQVLVYKIFQKFTHTGNLFSVRNPNFDIGDSLESIASYLHGNADCARMRLAVERHIDAFDPISTTRPRGIFCNEGRKTDDLRSADDHGFECVPIAVLDQVGYFLSEAREELRETMAAAAVALKAAPFESHPNEIDGRDSSAKDCAFPAVGASGSSTNVQPNGNSDIQKKIASLTFGDGSPAPDVEDGLLLSSIESRAKELIRMRQSRQDLVVVASLLSHIPNLAGLARTCEVFKASSLVVPDATIADDRQFQLISVTADQWIPLVEVPEAALSKYLHGKKREGYSVLGLEQTANSVPINKYVFPEKVVLVLGRESDGIPVDVIQALDKCVEIPQLGVIRSLNVHVSGAIAVWEYTRQHLISHERPNPETVM